MTHADRLADYLKSEFKGIKTSLYEPMSAHTTFLIGGPAKIMAFPQTAEEIYALCAAAREFSVPAVIMGNGSNLLVSDAGIDALVIKTYDGLSEIRADEGGILKAGAGALLSKISVFAQKAGLSGMEFACGIPGSAGGAVYMNAGAYGGEMKDIVEETKYLDKSLEIKKMDKNMHGFGYRESIFSENGGIILEVKLKLRFSEPGVIRTQMDEILKKRREKQPVELPSAGSVFKRPPGDFAGRLIEEAGLSGYRIGGAQVSEKHAGFIVNRGGASCDDVLRLIEHVQNTVLKRSGIELRTEIKIIK